MNSVHKNLRMSAKDYPDFKALCKVNQIPFTVDRLSRIFQVHNSLKSRKLYMNLS